MYCKYCGKEIDDNAKFCKHCGKELVEATKSKDKSKSKTLHVFKQWWFWIIVALSVALVIGLVALVTSSAKKAAPSTENKIAEETTDDTEESQDKENENAEEDEESGEEEIDWLSKEYVVISLYNKETKKTTDISSGFGLKVDNSGTLVNVNDELGHYWGQEWIDDNIEVKMEKYGKGGKDITIYVNDSLVANGENLCVDGGTSLLNVHPLMDSSKYEAQTWLEDEDIVKIVVE